MQSLTINATGTTKVVQPRMTVGRSTASAFAHHKPSPMAQAAQFNASALGSKNKYSLQMMESKSGFQSQRKTLAAPVRAMAPSSGPVGFKGNGVTPAGNCYTEWRKERNQRNAQWV